MTTLNPTLARPGTLADLIPGSGAIAVVRDAGLVIGGAALTGLAAQVSVLIPSIFTPVPFTMQTFAVLWWGRSSGRCAVLFDGPVDLRRWTGGCSLVRAVVATTALRGGQVHRWATWSASSRCCGGRLLSSSAATIDTSSRQLRDDAGDAIVYLVGVAGSDR